MQPQRPVQKLATNNGRGYCDSEGTVQVFTQESSKGMLTDAGARVKKTLAEMADAAVFEAADVAFFEAADEAGGIRTSEQTGCKLVFGPKWRSVV